MKKVPRCEDCGMRVGFSDPQRFRALHRSFKGPEHTVCNKEYRMKVTLEQASYWFEEYLAAAHAGSET